MTQTMSLAAAVVQKMNEHSLLVMVAIWNRADHYINFHAVVSYYLLSIFSSLNLSGRTLDVYHTSTHGVVLVRI